MSWTVRSADNADVVMRDLVPIFLSFLAWCCLAIPWQFCASDCRDGGLQPLFHGCHPAAETTVSCHCADHEADPSEDLDHCCEPGEHAGFILPQTSPDAPDEFEVEPDQIAWGVGADGLSPAPIRSCGLVASVGDPPRGDPPWLAELRRQVLLI